ncbi:hypothetical protein V2A60_003491 [Cordyceps javanica]|uniref:Endo-chitosanase n=1 Tax=Cordyceps javanica TaxID=43265 RepID=A0A545V2Y4_9HYPO|nr:fungal chitosanase of glycosyl hydrolase group 75 domain-containing protein [Cordyceps javanica]TQW07355.1 fungal chitosanase of glycosyl hydrolase group 75 domain-containing protein [Cordyceps javanica]
MSCCGDYLQNLVVVYLPGPGKFSDMDVDCEGAQGGPQDGGRCDAFTDTQETTALKWVIEGYDVGVRDLSPHEHGLLVFGNPGTKPGSETFSPRDVGVEPASLMAVICRYQLIYMIGLGDSDTDDGPRPSVSEVSISLGTACYGKDMQAGTGFNTSHTVRDVLHIAPKAVNAVPGPERGKLDGGELRRLPR